MDYNFEKVLSIDPLKLGDEWLKQPGLFMYWSKKSVDAREKMERLKFDLDKYEACLAAQVRKDPSSYGLEKVTESAINQFVASDAQVIKLNEMLIGLRAEAELLNRMVTALEQRKKALENLVYLNQQDYFSLPTTHNKRSRKREE